MKCDLCKREAQGQRILCETCGDAIRRLVVINRQTEQFEKAPVLVRANAA